MSCQQGPSISIMTQPNLEDANSRLGGGSTSSKSQFDEGWNREDSQLSARRSIFEAYKILHVQREDNVVRA